MKLDKKTLCRVSKVVVDCLSAGDAAVVFKWLVAYRAGEECNVTPTGYSVAAYMAFTFICTLEELYKGATDE